MRQLARTVTDHSPLKSLLLVQAVAGEMQSLRRCGGIENRENSLNRIQEVGADPTSVAAFIEAFQASMLKAPNHQSYCKVIIVTCQFYETVYRNKGISGRGAEI
jgi:hypothetical protein